MVHYHNRILNLDEHWLPRVVYEWEKSLNVKAWYHDIVNITRILHLPPPDTECMYDLATVEPALQKRAEDIWWEVANSMSKLRSFVEFRDKESSGSIVRNNLKRQNRSLLAKLVAGILPLKIETGRYVNTPHDKKDFVPSATLIWLKTSTIFS